MRQSLGTLFVLGSMTITACGTAADLNGFNVEGGIIPADEIHSGGPPRDGIPAINEPRFEPAESARNIEPTDRVLGLDYNGIARAYPVDVMNWHEIVNDEFGDEAVVVTFCPLCGTGMAFSAELEGGRLEFGVSGLLYNSDVLLYDRSTESLWSQLLSQAVTGPMKGTRLKPLPLSHTTWEQWLQRYPGTRVLSRETGYGRDYDRDPYAGYETSEGIYFPVRNRDPRYHPKERVLGLQLGGLFKAYPFSELARTGSKVITDSLAGRSFEVQFDSRAGTARIIDPQGREIPTVIGFWFAWYAFHPETGVYEAP